ncbi:MAG: TonB-dependent siderophore receptor [Elainellaceae cyanobacterium]
MLNRLQSLFIVTSILSLLPLSGAWANSPSVEAVSSDVEGDAPATTVSDWMAQIEASLTQITDIQLESSEDGLAIALQTAGEELARPTTEIVGNALILEIPSAVLALPGGDDRFEQFEPAEGIALVSAMNLSDSRVQVTITGTDAPPTADVIATETGLTLGVIPGVAQVGDADDAIQIVVTGEQDDYALPPTPDVTRLDIPLRDLPRSVQIIPDEVIEDQAATRIRDALRNVSGVVQDGGFAGTADQFNIRGFFSGDIFRDGFRDPSNIFETSNIERIEVLKGPASILFGNIEPGGAINIVTEQPLPFPFYAAELEIGSFEFVRPTLDFSGPITTDGALRYRLNAAYEHSDGFRDLNQDVQRFFVAPVLALDIGDRTDLVLEFSYLDDERPFDRGLLAVGRDVIDVPVRRFFGEPDDFRDVEEISAGYRFNHQLSDNWEIRSAFRVVTVDDIDFRAEPLALDEETGLLSRNFRSNDDVSESYTLQNEVQGQFTTGPIDHRLIFGIDLSRQTSGGTQRRLPPDLTPDIDVFDPEYDQIPIPDFDDLTVVVRDNLNRTDSLGLYLQDLIEITDNFKLLLGGRLDFVEQESRDFLSDTTSEQEPDAFSPTVGLLYQPIEPLSLYANFARSFQPNFGTQVDGSFIDPERGTQFEIGARGEFLDGGLTASLALYRIVKDNVATTDPDNPDFTIPAGEQRSQGVELDVIGRILPGWNVIASYSYIDAEITEEVFGLTEGSRISNVPEHSASLWTTYEIQNGNLQGLGFGAGLFYVGERAGDFFDTFDLPSYVRTDAAVFYERDRWRAAVNIQNLFDIDYFIANNFGRVAIEPGAPLTVIGSVSVEF